MATGFSGDVERAGALSSADDSGDCRESELWNCSGSALLTAASLVVHVRRRDGRFVSRRAVCDRVFEDRQTRQDGRLKRIPQQNATAPLRKPGAGWSKRLRKCALVR